MKALGVSQPSPLLAYRWFVHPLLHEVHSEGPGGELQGPNPSAEQGEGWCTTAGCSRNRAGGVHTHMQAQTLCSVTLGAENLTLQP